MARAYNPMMARAYNHDGLWQQDPAQQGPPQEFLDLPPARRQDE